MEKIYVGTSSKGTFEVIAKYNNEKFGVCLNMFKFDQTLIKKFKILEDLDLNLFMDNGSFERFQDFLKGNVSPEKYLSYEISNEYFNTITNQYEELLKLSKNPKKIILTIPEVIGSADLTKNLQKNYIQKYADLEETYNVKIIISLQFNPNEKNWKQEAQEVAKFIRNNAPKSWIIGIPFGNDFKVLQKKNNFEVIETLFRTTLKGYKAHLFACGSINKIEKFVVGNEDFIYSIDASSLMNIAKYSHYLSVKSGKVLDIRALKGKNVKEETAEIKRRELEDDSGMTLSKWEEMKYLERFDITIRNFQEILIFFNFNSFGMKQFKIDDFIPQKPLEA